MPAPSEPLDHKCPEQPSHLTNHRKDGPPILEYRTPEPEPDQSNAPPQHVGQTALLFAAAAFLLHATGTIIDIPNRTQAGQHLETLGRTLEVCALPLCVLGLPIAIVAVARDSDGRLGLLSLLLIFACAILHVCTFWPLYRQCF